MPGDRVEGLGFRVSDDRVEGLFCQCLGFRV